MESGGDEVIVCSVSTVSSYVPVTPLGRYQIHPESKGDVAMLKMFGTFTPGCLVTIFRAFDLSRITLKKSIG